MTFDVQSDMADARGQSVSPVPGKELERLTTLLEARGIDLSHPTDNSLEKLRQLIGDRNALFSLLRDAGISRDSMRDAVIACAPRKIEHPLIAGVAVGGSAGLVLGLLVTPIANLILEGRTSWHKCVKTAPKAATAGLLLGTGIGKLVAERGNQQRARDIEAALGQLDACEMSWAELEVKRRERGGVVSTSPAIRS